MNKNYLVAHTLIELVIAITIIAILATVVYAIIRPPQIYEDTQYTQALTELAEIGKAIQYYAADNGAFPPDVNRGLPAGIERYLAPEQRWPVGPLEGSIYDYDNWSGKTCLDPEASGSIQITLREVPDRNPDGSNVWAWYYVLYGKGMPHCNTASEAYLGECVNCGDFEL